MVFSSLVFLCIFFPIVFAAHCFVPSLKVKNILLIVASLLFYSFGEPVYVILMVASAFANYLCALALGRFNRKAVVTISVIINIGVLCVFKYTGFIVGTINAWSGAHIPVPQIALPVGISFFTFQAMSYVIDVYRGNVDVQKNFAKVLLYISFFPQLIAGPIVKYRDIAKEIDQRVISVKDIAPGLRRFITGLGKKVIIANAMAVCADNIFSQDLAQINILGAWIGAIAYLMQIYFDFSGYSDMAIGMGRMFGFHFKENFDFPYVSQNIKEFWCRWHISLSSWFKEYVYIPLGGNRKGKGRTVLNKIIVFFLTGLWHGANWTFVIWGLFNGLFIFLEEYVPALRKMPRVIRHVYLIAVVTVGLVIFRADTIGYGFGMIGRMFSGFDLSAGSMSVVLQQLTPQFIVMLIIAIAVCGPLSNVIKRIRNGAENNALSKKENIVQIVFYTAAFALLAWCVIRLSSGAYNPFIYFRF